MTISQVSALCVLALFCAAHGPGIFEGDNGVSEIQKQGGVEFNAANGEYRVTGAGGDIWGTADGFHFVWKKMSGDMVLDANAQFTGTGAMSHRLTSLQFRPTAGAISQDGRVIPKSDVSGPVANASVGGGK